MTLRVAIDVSLQGRPAPTGVERAQATLLAAAAAPAAARGIELVPLAARALPLALWRETALPGLLAQQRIDVFHSPVAAVPLRAPCPVIATLHELPWVAGRDADDDGGDNAGDRRLRHRARTALAAALADRLVCVSRRTREHLLARHPAAAGRAVVIPHGVDARFLERGRAPPVRSPAGGAALEALGARPYVLAVGRLRRKKNLLALLEAFAGARGAAGHALVLAGPPGDASDELAALAARPDLAGRVLRPGFVDDARLAELYRGAAAVCFPSLFEGFGLPVLEAMACGAPVVASRQGAAAELLHDELTGEPVVEPCDARETASIAAALGAVLGSPARAAALVAAGRRQAQRFSASRQAEATLALYEQCAAAGARR